MEATEVRVDERPAPPAVAPGDEAGQVIVLDVAEGPDEALYALVDTDLGLLLVTLPLD